MAPGGRGVPDVAGCAGPYRWRIFGQDRTDAEGTSAVSPLWAGLIARINQALGYSVGFTHCHLYKELRDAIQSIGDNAQSQAGPEQDLYILPDWDFGTGLGRPHGGKLLEGLRELSDS